MMKVDQLRRYPVKSMLGEPLDAAAFTTGGLEHDRGFALIDAETGFVATAKHPRLWRNLLRYSAAVDRGRTVITSADGTTLDVTDPEASARLSAALGRTVQLSDRRPAAASVERPDPEDVLREGVEAPVDAPTLEIAQGSTGTNFVDYAPVHLITTATLAEVGTEPLRYRPNLVIATPPGTGAFVENDWSGQELRIGSVVLRVTIPTPRCSVPTLEHGDLPRDPRAVRALLADNRVEVPGFGVLPCAGAYAEVLTAGTVRTGDEVTLVPR